ncbi:hypothetical protein DZA51_02005 [Vibrio campbellii]|nr:hypothetical protein DZA51_02005 [Vibrio campbellii]
MNTLSILRWQVCDLLRAYPKLLDIVTILDFFIKLNLEGNFPRTFPSNVKMKKSPSISSGFRIRERRGD